MAKQMVDKGGPEYEGAHSHFSRINKKYKNALNNDVDIIGRFISEYGKSNNLYSSDEMGLLFDILTYRTNKEICERRNMTVVQRRIAMKNLSNKLNVLNKKHIIYSFILYIAKKDELDI